MSQFSASFFIGNRGRLCDALPDSVVLIAAHCALQQSADVSYPFRQESNFWYLCGINEPDLVLLIDTRSRRSTLFLPEQNDYQIEWDGQVNKSDLQKASGIDGIEPRTALVATLKHAKKQGLRFCSLKPAPEKIEPYGFYSNPSRRLLYEVLQEVEPDPQDIRLELARLRQVKQPAELHALERAIQVTGEVLSGVKAELGSFRTEKDIERAITAGFFSGGTDGHAYEPIIASGKHAAVIHYNANNGLIENNDLLLLDVGALVSGYAADVSRTWAVGKPTELQKRVYDAVRRLQDKAFTLLRSGVILKEFQQKIEQAAFAEVENLGLTLDRYPHGISHFLGLDVHDAGDYEAPLPLGTVITVEPGLYFKEQKIGVRIEDDVLITKNGIRILSDKIPREL